MHAVHGMVVVAMTLASPRLKRLQRLTSAWSMYFWRLSLSAQKPSGASYPGTSPLYAVPITRLSKSSAAAPTFLYGSSLRRLAT